jgi:nucleotide-binding universal stress UspA family protein
MPRGLFDRVVIPVASEMDAIVTCEAVIPYLSETQGEAHVVHIIEKTEGYMDKASSEQMELAAGRIFDVASDTLRNADFTSFETHLRYGTNVVETIYDACEDLDATAVVFVTRKTSRWKRFLTGDVALKLVTQNPYPAIVLPEPGSEPESAREGDTQS